MITLGYFRNKKNHEVYAFLGLILNVSNHNTGTMALYCNSKSSRPYVREAVEFREKFEPIEGGDWSCFDNELRAMQDEQNYMPSIGGVQNAPQGT